jgi:hypothetical protein
MSSFGGSVGHEKKLETAKEKKEQADKAFQASDIITGTSAISFFMCGIAQRAFG